MLRANGRNIVGCYILRPFAHPVACCWELLRKQFETGQTLSYVQTNASIPNNVGELLANNFAILLLFNILILGCFIPDDVLLLH